MTAARTVGSKHRQAVANTLSTAGQAAKTGATVVLGGVAIAVTTVGGYLAGLVVGDRKPRKARTITTATPAGRRK